MKSWFSTLGYRFEKHNNSEDKYFEWIITIPTRRNYERIFVRGVEREADLSDVHSVRESVSRHNVDEGWVVAPRRVSQLANQEARNSLHKNNVYCYSFDELIDQEVDFSKYFEWLKQQIISQSINLYYVPLACKKEEFDHRTKQHLGISLYAEENGWIDGYINRWLDDPSKEHISVLGEFGTGKTWFALHFAWNLLEKYLKAKEDGTERPRIPLVISLRDYAKAVSVESLFSEFFFRKHKIELRGGYPTFEQLNRMGKLLLIFDGFDEMAARISWQDMVNNFWELAKVVVPGSKAILTCRTEHFPEARKGRAILNAELKASTSNLTGEPPQFEVLELEKFNKKQIQKVLSFQANSDTISKIMRNSKLLDLARRPVMIDLIVEALPLIEEEKELDIARIYLYAISRKMERDITQERTFTSIIDKVFFLCELAWEMLTTNNLSLNYRDFPNRIRYIFGATVQEQKELDHWHYDMLGQTILTRNSMGDYTFAHRSFLEFFVAFKLSSELGIIAFDFIEFLLGDLNFSGKSDASNSTWLLLFRNHISNMSTEEYNSFDLNEQIDSESVYSRFGKISLAVAEKAILELLEMMIDKSDSTIHKLLKAIDKTKDKKPEEVGYLGGNAVTLLLRCNNSVLIGEDLSKSVIINADFTTANLSNTSFSDAYLKDCVFAQTFGSVFSLSFSQSSQENLLAIGDATGTIRIFDIPGCRNPLVLAGHGGLVRSISFSFDDKILASGSEDGTIRLWDIQTGKCLHILDQHAKGVRSVAFSSDGKKLVSGSEDGTIRLWDIQIGECFHILEQHTKGVRSVAFSFNGSKLASGSEDGTIRLWDVQIYKCLYVLDQGANSTWAIRFDRDDRVIASGTDGLITIWDYENNSSQFLEGHTDRIRSIAIDHNINILASGSEDKTVRLWDINSNNCIAVLEGHKNWVRSVAFSSDGKFLASGSEDKIVKIWSIPELKCINTLVGSVGFTKAIAFSSDGRIIASSSNENAIKTWNIDESLPINTFVGNTNFVRSLCFSNDNNKVISGSDDGVIRIWDVDDGRQITSFIGHKGWVNTLSTTSNIVVSGGEDKVVRVWDISSGQCLNELNGHRDGIRSVAISLDGSRIASGSADNSIKLWQSSDGICLSTLTGHQDWVISIAFSHSGHFLATGSSGKTIKVWNLENFQLLLEINGHQDWVYSVVFTTDDRYLISSSRDGTIRFWDVLSGKCVNKIDQYLIPLSATFNKTRSLLACGCEDGAIRFWNINDGIEANTIYDRAYEGMNICGVRGVTNSQIHTLKFLGANDNSIS